MKRSDGRGFLADRRGDARSVAFGTVAGTVLVGILAYAIFGALGGLGIGILAGIVTMLLAFVPVLLVALLVNSAVVVVDAYEKEALTVFGEFREVLGPGINLVPPLVSETHAFDMRTQTVDVPSQEAITEDNSPVVADAVLYIRVMDAERAFLEVEDYERAVSNLGQTTLRAVLGDMKLDETLHERRKINERIRKEIAGPTDQWGVRIEAVEVQAINPSKDVVRSMEQQTSAERRRRAMILEAQGERRSEVERAQGQKQSDILAAQGEKQAEILESQGEAISTVLRARAADAMGERAVIDKGIETLESIGEGESTTYVLPQETTSLLGRYGKHLTGSDVGEGTTLESGEFDADDREMLGLDDIADIVDGIDAHGDSDIDAIREADEAFDEEGTGRAAEDEEIEAIREADDSFAESETIREADDADSDVEAIAEADDGTASVEEIREADDADSDVEEIQEADDAGSEFEEVPEADEEAASAGESPETERN